MNETNETNEMNETNELMRAICIAKPRMNNGVCNECSIGHTGQDAQLGAAHHGESYFATEEESQSRIDAAVARSVGQPPADALSRARRSWRNRRPDQHVRNHRRQSLRSRSVLYAFLIACLATPSPPPPVDAK